MKPLFTLHAGEYLVAAHIERNITGARVWVPLTDSGIDLLVSNGSNRKTVSLQVKYSKDFLVTHMPIDLRQDLRASGWWTINREKLANSPADLWVFVLQGFASRTTDFVIVSPQDFLKRLEAIHGPRNKFQTYICTSVENLCWLWRGLRRADLIQIAAGQYRNPNRDLTKWLNNWQVIEKMAKT